MRKRPPSIIYGNVIERDGRHIYSSFGTDLAAMIDAAETRLSGVIAIEEAHQGKPPLWTRPLPAIVPTVQESHDA